MKEEGRQSGGVVLVVAKSWQSLSGLKLEASFGSLYLVCTIGRQSYDRRIKLSKDVGCQLCLEDVIMS